MSSSVAKRGKRGWLIASTACGGDSGCQNTWFWDSGDRFKIAAIKASEVMAQQWELALCRCV